MVTLSDINKAFNLDPDNIKQVTANYGKVVSINPDKTYQVSLNGSDTTVKCARLTGAKVGDVVLVTTLKNGYSVVTGCVGGDTDAADAQATADGVAQHFWYDTDGAHVTEDTREDYEADPSSAGSNSLFTATGIFLRKALQKFAEFLTTGLTVYNGSGATIAHLGYGPGKNSGGGTANAPYYTLGQRRATAKTEDGVIYQPDIGNYSTAQGVGLISSGYASVAEGVDTIAAGSYSHAEGEDSVAAASWSHAGGSSCYAYGQDSYAGGAFCKAVGNDSHAEGMGTVAGWGQQFVIGTLNNNKSDNVFEIGNGFSSGSKSNAFEVGWDGHIKCNELNPFTTFTATGTVTLNANSGENVTVTGTVPTGYTPIAVQSIETAHNQTCLIGKFTLTSNGASITLRNVSSSQYTNMSVTATILCTSLQ